MATKRYDPTATDFNGRYTRWITALESGNEAELLEATLALPTLNKRVLKKLAAVDRDEPDSTVRAERKRVIVLLSEINANQAARLRERKQAEQRRRDRTVRVERRVELPTTCARCGTKLKEVKSTGRPRLSCSPACRTAAYEDRRAHRDGAVKVQVVEKVVSEVRERRIEVPTREPTASTPCSTTTTLSSRPCGCSSTTSLTRTMKHSTPISRGSGTSTTTPKSSTRRS